MKPNRHYEERLEDVPGDLFGTELGITLDRYHLLLKGLDQKERLKRVDALDMFNRIVNSIQTDIENLPPEDRKNRWNF